MPTLVLFPAARRIDPPDIGEICPEICRAPWGVPCTLSRKFFEDRIESCHIESRTGAQKDRDHAMEPQDPGTFAKVVALLRAGASLDNVSDNASAETVLQQWEAEVVTMHGRPLNDESRFHIAANVATVNALVADVRRAGGSWKLWTLLSPTAYFFSEARLTDSHTGRPRRCSGSGRRSRAVK